MNTFDLEIPSPETMKEELVQELLPPAPQQQAITEIVPQKAQQILTVDLDDFDEKKELSSAFETFGQDIIQKSESRNAILQTRMKDLSKPGGESGEVAKGLAELSTKMKDLDPSALDFTKTGPLGKLFNPVRRYFDRYKTADEEIAEIVKSLEKGRKTLKQDNTTLELESHNMRELTKQLNQKIELGTQLDAYLTNQIETHLAATEEEDERLKFIQEEILFPLRQRLMDFQSLLAVNQQGIIAMDIIRKNNLELIRAVDRAKTVTVAALRTAVTVAGALYNQKIVLEKITMLNETTNQMIGATARMLKEQGVAIQKQATEANISPETLKQAFADTISALDDISKYKQKALPQMQATIQEFKNIAEEGEKQLNRIDKREKFSL